MKIDAYTHFIPDHFYKDVLSAGSYTDIGKRMKGIPSIYDLKTRLKVVDKFKDYAQVLSYGMPPLEVMTKNPAQAEEYARIINDGFAELCAQYPDHFPGWVAQTPLGAPDAGVREVQARAEDGRARRADLHQRRRQAARRSAVRAVLEGDEQDRQADLAASLRAAPAIPDYPTESKSKYEIWWTFGWSYETAAAMARLVFSRIMDKHPNLKIITHHFGGIVPMLEGRIGPGWDQIGARTSDEDLSKVAKKLKKRPLDYFKNDFYADTAAFTGKPATVCGMSFYPFKNIVFASDCPFDPEKGTMYIRETIKILDALDLSKAKRKQLYYGNLESGHRRQAGEVSVIRPGADIARQLIRPEQNARPRGRAFRFCGCSSSVHLPLPVDSAGMRCESAMAGFAHGSR